jgi:hypothetical protein
MLRASIIDVLERSMPRLITLDGVDAPDVLNFEIPVSWIPGWMYRKAHALVQDTNKSIYKYNQLDTGKGANHKFYYVLSRSQKVHTTMSHALVKR